MKTVSCVHANPSSTQSSRAAARTGLYILGPGSRRLARGVWPGGRPGCASTDHGTTDDCQTDERGGGRRRTNHRDQRERTRRPDCSHDLQNALGPTVDVFAPIFFVSIGAQLDVRYLNPFDAANRPALLLALALVATGVLGKFAAGFSAWGKVRRSFIGAGMVPRGEVGLIFAQIGRQNGALPEPAFIAVVLAVFATTFVTPPLLKALKPAAP